MSKHKTRTRDTSPQILQAPKVGFQINIRERFTLTGRQREIMDSALDKSVKMVVLDGVAGTAKTYCAVLASLRLVESKAVSGIVYIRSLVQARDGMTGYLAGDLAEKTKPYGVPFFDKLDEFLPRPEVDRLEREGRLEVAPTAMLRGCQFAAKAVVMDEAQNATFDSLYTVATRMGMFSKLFVIGDSRLQNDLGRTSGFREFCGIFSDRESRDNGVRVFNLGGEDIFRSPFVKFVVTKVEKHRSGS